MDRAGPTDYDAELRLHNEVLRRAWRVQPGEQVLDIGCGSGQTTCEAARIARAGSALGVDISASAIERARELARAQGVHNVTFERADAHGPERGDQLFSLPFLRLEPGDQRNFRHPSAPLATWLSSSSMPGEGTG